MKHPRLLAISALCLMVLAVRTREAGPEDLPVQSFELICDGESVTVREGETVTVKCSADPTRTHSLQVRRKTEQDYATDALAFRYHSSFSLRDDHDTENRTLTLIIAEGVSIVITDFGDGTEAEIDGLLATFAGRLKQNWTANHGKLISETQAAKVKFGRSKGKLAVFHYQDPDGDQHFARVHVLAAGGRVFSCTVQCTPEQDEAATRLAEPTLRSIGAK